MHSTIHWYYLCWAKVSPQFDQLSPPPPLLLKLPIFHYVDDKKADLKTKLVHSLSLHITADIQKMICFKA